MNTNTPPVIPKEMAMDKKMGRYKRSWLTIKQSWHLLKKNTYFMAFPLAGMITSLLVFVLFITSLFSVSLALNPDPESETRSTTLLPAEEIVENKLDEQELSVPVVETQALIADEPVLAPEGSRAIEQEEDFGVEELIMLLAVAVFLILFGFISFLFQAGLVAAVYDELSGTKSSFGQGMSKAWSKSKQLLYWTAITLTVGLVIRIIQERFGWLGLILGWIAEIGWALASMFVIPVIVTEDVPANKAIETSSKIFKQTWGEGVVLNLAFGAIFGLVVLIGVLLYIPFVGWLVLAGIGGSEMVIGAIVFGVLLLFVVAFIQHALISIFKVVLYKYATTQEVPAGFDKQILDSSVVKKKDKKKYK